MTKNAKLSGYFNMNIKIEGDFQICIIYHQEFNWKYSHLFSFKDNTLISIYV